MKKGKQIIITPNEEVKTVDYTGYESIRDGVNGSIERCGSLDIDTPLGSLKTDLYCNDSFLISDKEEFNKINAVASLFTGQEIRGDVVLLVNEGCDNRGFEYLETPDGEEDLCECWFVEDKLLLFINHAKEDIEMLHEDYDDNKSEPVFEFIEMTADELEQQIG